MSYRVSDHSTSDDSFAYRTHSEVDSWKNGHDPISRLRRWMEKEGLWSAELDKETKISIRKEILKEMAAAEKEKKPALRAVFDDVYAELTEEQEAQKSDLKRMLLKYSAEYDVDEYESGIQGI